MSPVGVLSLMAHLLVIGLSGLTRRERAVQVVLELLDRLMRLHPRWCSSCKHGRQIRLLDRRMLTEVGR